MNTPEFYFQKLQAVSRANLRRFALTPTMPKTMSTVVLEALRIDDLESARKQLAFWLYSLYRSGVDPSVTRWHDWLPAQEIPKYFDPFFDLPGNQKAGRITPRNKYRQAIYTLRKQFPFSTLTATYSWHNRDRLYKHLNRLGWHWEKGRRLGYWSDVCF